MNNNINKDTKDRDKESLVTPSDIEKVHVVYKSHFDIGFTNSAQKMVHDIVNWQLDLAIDQAERFRNEGYGKYFAWTLPSWLVWHALEVKKGGSLKRLEDAILRDDIVWTATPFTPHTEFMDASLFKHAISLSKLLDKRFGKETIAAKFTDVPGNTIGMLSVLAEQGIKLMQVGVNHMSAMPDVPPVFLWRDRNGNEIIVMYCRGYGDTAIFPGSQQVLAQQLKGDNMELPGWDEVISQMENLKKTYPNAVVEATSYSSFAKHVLHLKDNLPVMTCEIGDSWIHGVGSDPLKIAQYRALSRFRQSLLNNETSGWNDTDMIQFSNNLMLVAEHTWGVSHMPHLADSINWDNASFHSVKHRGTYRSLEASWQEQRDYIEYAVDSLMNIQTKQMAKDALAAVRPVRPSLDGMVRFDAEKEIVYGGYRFKVCPQSGAIISLIDEYSGTQYADHTHRLGAFMYQTFDADDFKRYIKQYCAFYTENLETEFGKKGIEKTYAKSCNWPIRATNFYVQTDDKGMKIVTVLAMPEKCRELYGGVRELYNEIWIPAYDADQHERKISFKLSWFNKTETRQPEAFWYSFNPIVNNPEKWMMDKMGYDVSPIDVVSNGGHKLHAVCDGVHYNEPGVSIRVVTLDAALAAPGKPGLTEFDNAKPEMSGGWHFNLFNNIWNTNFVGWYGDDASFRFDVCFEGNGYK